MKEFEVFSLDLVRSNLNVPGHGLISMQLSYSTADIEKSVFYEPEFSPIMPVQPLGNATILVVHGEMFVLEEGAIPQPAVRLTEQSGLFRVIETTEQGQA